MCPRVTRALTLTLIINNHYYDNTHVMVDGHEIVYCLNIAPYYTNTSRTLKSNKLNCILSWIDKMFIMQT